MSRTPLLLSAVALAACLLLPAAAANGVGPDEGTVVKVELDLKTDNDLHAHLETSENEEVVTLKLWRPGQSVEYMVPGKATAAGLNVSFGKLGKIDVAFTPTKTLGSTEPGAGCTGPPRTVREGVFSGTIDFTGERGYVRIQAPQATGTMGVISQWNCAEAEAGGEPLARTARAPRAKPPMKRSERETATLSAYGRDRYFAAGVHHRHSGGKSIFTGAEIEIVEEMEIIRATRAWGPASAFDFDHAAGTATLHAPRPLSGSATFRARPGARPLWHSTIRVPLLGAAPLYTGAPGFAVELHREYQFD